jgi:hypothetical protein
MVCYDPSKNPSINISSDLANFAKSNIVRKITMDDLQAQKSQSNDWLLKIYLN